MSSFSSQIESLPVDLQSVMLSELHRIARRFMQSESNDHTLQATALVNEAYVKLSAKSMVISDKQHFIAIAAQQMRRILVDHAREKNALKRGGPQVKMTLVDEHVDASSNNANQALELIYVDKLLNELSTFDERASKVFELKMFSMMTNPEIAKVMSLSLATVERDLKAAKAWFAVQLKKKA